MEAMQGVVAEPVRSLLNLIIMGGKGAGRRTECVLNLQPADCAVCQLSVAWIKVENL